MATISPLKSIILLEIYDERREQRKGVVAPFALIQREIAKAGQDFG
jgi:hypothetical protein